MRKLFRRIRFWLRWRRWSRGSLAWVKMRCVRCGEPMVGMCLMVCDDCLRVGRS